MSLHAQLEYKSLDTARHHLEVKSVVNSITFLDAPLVPYRMIYTNNPYIIFAFSGGQNNLPSCPD